MNEITHPVRAMKSSVPRLELAVGGCTKLEVDADDGIFLFVSPSFFFTMTYFIFGLGRLTQDILRMVVVACNRRS